MYLPPTLQPREPTGFGFFADDNAPDHGHDGDGNNNNNNNGKRLQNWSSLIGIITAIIGNVLIALALNVQRYAHIRLHRQRIEVRERAQTASRKSHGGSGGRDSGSYGTVGRHGDEVPDLSPHGYHDLDGADETDPLARSFHSVDTSASEDERKTSSTYLKSPYWWLGQVLITVGELGNFLAYGFAPASIVSPLGVVALVSNCVIAPILFKEIFRQRDFWGVLIAIGGAVTVVLSAKQQETKLEPHDVWDAITSLAFEIYLLVSLILIAVLMWLSPKYGNRTILIDLGLVGLFGGYTALATKGVSSMLSSTLFRAFTTPVTYTLIFVLLSTAVMQVRYVNKALQRFDSTQVIPVQFVMFTLSVIIGSAVLYRDFERTTAQQAVKFVGGCLLTFFGVFIITSGRPQADDDEDQLSEVEGVDETIGLAEQLHPDEPLPQPENRGFSAAGSRRSSQASRGSRVNFADRVTNPLTSMMDQGVLSPRVPGGSASRTSVLPSPAAEDGPLMDNPWKDPQEDGQTHPGMGVQTISSDSVLTLNTDVSTHSASNTVVPPSTPPNHTIFSASASTPTGLPTGGSPVTPRASISRTHSHHSHYAGPLFSPSPLSSTVSAVVSDTLRRHHHHHHHHHLITGGESPQRLAATGSIAGRRSRPSLRHSIFGTGADLGDPYAYDDEVAAESPAAEEDPLAPAYGEHDGEFDRHGRRRRTRSLSQTLGGFFYTRRKRRGSNPEGANAPARASETALLGGGSRTRTSVGVGGRGGA